MYKVHRTKYFFHLLTEETTFVEKQTTGSQNQDSSKTTKNVENDECPTCDCICPNVEIIPKLFSNDQLKLKERTDILNGDSGSNQQPAGSSWTARPLISQNNNHNNDQLIQRTFDDSKIIFSGACEVVVRGKVKVTRFDL